MKKAPKKKASPKKKPRTRSPPQEMVGRIKSIRKKDVFIYKYFEIRIEKYNHSEMTFPLNKDNIYTLSNKQLEKYKIKEILPPTLLIGKISVWTPLLLKEGVVGQHFVIRLKRFIKNTSPFALFIEQTEQTKGGYSKIIQEYINSTNEEILIDVIPQLSIETIKYKHKRV